MVVQQKMVTPPPTDEQQEMQQKMMKYMMVIMGFMFYKVAAGLAVYFIASSVWGFTERALLPKKKKTPDQAPPPNPGSPVEAAASVAAVSSSSALESGGKPVPAPANSTAVVQEPRGRGRKQGRNKRNRVDLTKPAAPRRPSLKRLPDRPDRTYAHLAAPRNANASPSGGAISSNRRKRRIGPNARNRQQCPGLTPRRIDRAFGAGLR